MTPEQEIVYMNAQIASMMAEMEAMKAENATREHNGFTPAFTYYAFIALPEKYGLTHNQVISFFYPDRKE